MTKKPSSESSSGAGWYVYVRHWQASGGTKFPLPRRKKGYLFGKTTHNDLRFKGRGVESYHFRVDIPLVDDEKARITDLSTAGTWINGLLIRTATLDLRSGMVVRLGPHSLTFVLE